MSWSLRITVIIWGVEARLEQEKTENSIENEVIKWMSWSLGSTGPQWGEELDDEEPEDQGEDEGEDEDGLLPHGGVARVVAAVALLPVNTILLHKTKHYKFIAMKNIYKKL